MARYIEADKLIVGLGLSIKSWSADCNSNAPTMVRAYQDVLHRVENMPTAYVAPRAEVEQLKEELAIWQQNRFNIFQRLECYKMTRQEVAREIFEEIDKHRDKIHGIVLLLPEEIAALKKKYTEGKK